MNQTEIYRFQTKLFTSIIAIINIFVFSKMLGTYGTSFMLMVYGFFLIVYYLIAGSILNCYGKMLRSRITKSQYKNAKVLSDRTLILVIPLALLSIFIILFGAEEISRRLLSNEYCKIVLMIFAPIIFTRSISSFLEAKLRGDGIFVAEVASSITRQLSALLLGVFFIGKYNEYGAKISDLYMRNEYTGMYGAFGVGIAYLVAELIVICMLTAFSFLYRYKNSKSDLDGLKQVDKNSTIYKKLLGYGMSDYLLVFLFGFFVIFSCYVLKGNYEEYNIINGIYCMIICLLIFIFLITILQVTGKAISFERKNDRKGFRNYVLVGLHFSFSNSVFWTFYLVVLSSQISVLFLKEEMTLLSESLVKGSSLVVLLSTNIYLTFVLYEIGRRLISFVIWLASDVLMIVAYIIFLNGKMSITDSLIFSFIIGLLACFIALNFIYIYFLKIPIYIIQIYIVPIFSAALSALVVIPLRILLYPHVGCVLCIITCGVLAYVIHWTLLLVLRNYREQDFKHILFGKIIRAYGQLLRVF